MRIVLANSFHYRRGGADIQFLDLAAALEKQGHSVARFSMHHPEDRESPWSPYWVPYVEYRREMTVAERLKALMRSTYSVDARRQMTRLLQDFQPDLVHFHSVQHHLTLAAVAACFDSHVPVVWTLHDYRSVCPSTALLSHGRPCEACRGGRYWHCVARRCKSGELSRSLAVTVESYLTHMLGWLRRVDCFVAPSRFLAETTTRMGLPAHRLEVVPNPVQPSGQPDFDGRSGTEVLYVGRLSPEKGVDVLLRALVGLPDARLRVHGDGPDWPRLRRLATDLGVDDRVCWEGWQPADAVAERMRKACLLAVPSICYENCPGSVLEAMVAGLPVVASHIGGLVELVDGGRAGWLVPAGDVESWRDGIGQVLQDPVSRRQSAATAYQRARARHDPERFLSRMVGIYRSVGLSSA